MSVAPVFFRRKRFLDAMEKAGITTDEKAVTIQEIIQRQELFPDNLFHNSTIRNRAVNIDVKFLSARGKLVKTADEKYYLKQ